MELTQKKLTGLQLVNWHYFENERIPVNGSTLVSGENTAGKSTILDAIQLVLTTNSRRFNVAANEKGNRSLKGYVRCKVGNVGETYHRKGTVPANVALEFYEEKGGRYFVLGVHLLSADEESPVIRKWYAEECRLEDLNFIVDGRAALADEFCCQGRRLRYIETDKAARDRFRHRMGNLEERFFDIIPKSLAFKPMDNVKEFINRFVLSEERVDVQGLKDTIETLGELEQVLEKTRKQLAGLDGILGKYGEVQGRERDIRVYDILLKLAARDACEERIEELEKEIRTKSRTMEGSLDTLRRMDHELQDYNDKIIALNVDIQNNSSNKLVENVRLAIQQLGKGLEEYRGQERTLGDKILELRAYLKCLAVIGRRVIERNELELLAAPVEEGKKSGVLERLEVHFQKEYRELEGERGRLTVRLEELDEEIRSLRGQQRSLEEGRLPYPEHTETLKRAVEEELERRGLDAEVYILSELLEVTDEEWLNAVEGCLGMRRFYLVVAPEFCEAALSVYDKLHADIHTAGIINTGTIPLEYEEDDRCLSHVVKSDNRYAKAYVNRVLGRVVRCAKPSALGQYESAVTVDGMLVQEFAVRRLDPADYETPYIGQGACRVQLEKVTRELEELSSVRADTRERLAELSDVVESGSRVNLEVIRLYLNAPYEVKKTEEELAGAQAELKEAESDPNLIELNIKLDAVRRQQEARTEERRRLMSDTEKLRLEVLGAGDRLMDEKQELSERSGALLAEADRHDLEYRQAEEKYEGSRAQQKTPQKIFDSFHPQKSRLENELGELLNGDSGLRSLQMQFNMEFTQDFAVGIEQIQDYREAADRLRRVEVVRYEEKLQRARENCEQIFRSDFLYKMKEHIENARTEFRSLNKALDRIYYGDDSYHFIITFDRRKEKLCRMIMSEYNMEGENNLWTGSFEEEYREEMEDLFAKLMVHDDKGERVLEEYTDYRSYLDYDIEIRKRNGQRQRFSDIYGEKSGSETQVPYYVAIAASFYQLYRFGNSVRLMLLDEAFDKMDDDRIRSMMDFFNSLKLQVILATPPGKIEVIGEQVDTILTAIRVGEGSIVEEYQG